MTPAEMTPGGTYRIEFPASLGHYKGQPRVLRGRLIRRIQVGGGPITLLMDCGDAGAYNIEEDAIRHVQSVDPVAANYPPRPLMPDQARGDW